MTTVAEFIAALQSSGEIKQSGNTQVPAALKRSLYKALSRLSSLRTTFTENTFSFTTTANQSEYSSATSGFPKDVGSFEFIEIDSGNGTYNPIEKGTLDEVRELLRSSGVLVDPLRPYLYIVSAGKLVLAPAPTTAVNCRGWYHRDARKDQATGSTIDPTVGTASDNYSNVWFNDGHDALWNLTMQIFYLAFDIDAERATYYRDEYDEAKRELTLQWLRLTRPGFRTRAFL